MTPRAVLLRTGLKPLSTAKSVYTAHPKPTMHCARPKTYFYKLAQSTIQRPFDKNPALTNRHFNHKVNTVRPRIVNTARSYRTPVNTVRPRVVNTARPNRTSVNVARANGFNAIKPSACWVWRPIKPNSKPQLDDKGFVNSECSRHMIGNIAYLSNFKQIDGGYVAFGGGAYGGKFLLPDENHILLKIPRKDNMYSFDMKNIVPKESFDLVLQVLMAKVIKGFFDRYSFDIQPFGYTILEPRVEENLHIGFLENKPMIEGTGPKWLFDIDSLTQSMNYVPVTAGTVSNDSAGTSEENSQDCIVMPIWKDTSYFDSPTKNVDNGLQMIAVLKKLMLLGKQDNTDKYPDVQTGSLKLKMFVGPSVKIHKDHPIDNVIGEVQSTRRMSKPTSEQGFLSDVLNQQALLKHYLIHPGGINPGRTSAIQTSTSLDNGGFPNGKKAIGTKWVFRNKKDEMGIMIRNKARRSDIIIKKQKGDILLVQVYVDDIIFGSTNKELCTSFEKLMKDKFQMSSMGELTFFLGIKTHLGISKEVGTPRYLSLVVPLTKVGDEAVHKELGDRMERAATTASSLEADQDNDTILGDVNAQTRFEITSKQFIDPPLSRGYTLRSGEDSIKLIGIDEILYTTFQLNAVKLKLMLPVQVSTVEEKPEESDGFAEIIDFLKASSISYALTVNPVIYTSCIEQFWATAKVQTFNGVRQLQALVDKKRVIVTESSIRRDLHLYDAEAFFSPQWKYFIHTITQGLSAKSIAWNKFSSSMASLIICLATSQKFNLSKYIFDAMVKHLDGGVKFLPWIIFHKSTIGAGKDFSGRITPLFDTMLVQPVEEMDEAEHEESVQTPYNDPQPSGEDSLQLTDLMILCTKLQTQVLDLQKAKDAQAKEIDALKKRIQRLERRKMSRPTGLKRLNKVGMSRRVKSSKDQESLGALKDASKQGRSIEDIDADVDDDVMHVEAKVDGKDEHSKKPNDSTAGEAVTTASINDSFEEQKRARKQEEEANIALIESWENTQAMMEADRLMVERLQSKESEELTDEEKAKLFMEQMEKRRKHFAALRAQEKRNKPPTKA
ncbi:putative ribonuclease H-like domain-containing protein [Tanacetum coccineum]